MKKYCILFLLFLFVYVTNGQAPLTGIWVGTDNTNSTGTFIFFDDGTVAIVEGGDTINAKKMSAEGLDVKIEYTLNETVVPHLLRITITESISQSAIGIMEATVLFLERDKIKMVMTKLRADGEDMNEENVVDDNTIILTRIK